MPAAPFAIVRGPDHCPLSFFLSCAPPITRPARRIDKTSFSNPVLNLHRPARQVGIFGLEAFAVRQAYSLTAMGLRSTLWCAGQHAWFRKSGTSALAICPEIALEPAALSGRKPDVRKSCPPSATQLADRATDLLVDFGRLADDEDIERCVKEERSFAAIHRPRLGSNRRLNEIDELLRIAGDPARLR